MIWRPIMEGKASHTDMDERDLYWLLDLNEAIDVWADMNDLTVQPPVTSETQGTAVIRHRL